MFRHLPLDRIRHSLAMNWYLNDPSAADNRRRYGANDIIERTGHPWFHLVRETLLDPMIWFLFATGILFFFLSQYTEALILLLAIIPIGGMDAFLHWRTQVSTQALSKRLMTYAMVMRDAGESRQIPSRELTVGDLVVVTAGDYFPADGIILFASNAQVDESSLTGETLPVRKQALTSLPSDENNPLIAYQHWGMVGTRLLMGRVIMRIVFTGKETLYGEIAASVMESHHEKTPLQRAIMRFVLTLIIVAIGFCILLAVVRYYQGFGIIDALLSAAVLAVAALPDEFPMVFTFFLGVGVYRLAQKHALVRRAVSVENIGRVTTICTDKTGTVTEGRFHAAVYRPVVSITQEELLGFACLASRRDSHDPLDAALFDAQPNEQHHHLEFIHTYPFTEDRKRETTVYHQNGGQLIVSKGAPEVLLGMSQLSKEELDYWQHQLIDLAKEGYKVIACTRYVAADNQVEEPAAGYEWLGLIAFIDPPRKEVYAAIQYCAMHRLQVLMVTGDHPDTARTIAAKIGLGNGVPNVVLAAEVEILLKSQGPAFLRHVDVIARAMPSQKFLIVNALKKLDEVVVVTGDGVNDVPALRAADIGIAMGERGTQSAREAASIILLDDNFGSIVNAISEGRQLFKNLQLSFKYLLMIHIPYVLSAILIPLFGFPLLYYPLQIVLIELFIHPTCMLVFQELPENRSMTAMPAPPYQPLSLFSTRDWWGIGVIGVYTTLMVLAAYFVSLKMTGDPAAARAVALAAVGMTHIALTIGLSRLKTRISQIVIAGSVVVLLVLLQVPVISHYFNMQPPGLAAWVSLSVFSLLTGFLSWWFS